MALLIIFSFSLFAFITVITFFIMLYINKKGNIKLNDVLDVTCFSGFVGIVSATLLFIFVLMFYYELNEVAVEMLSLFIRSIYFISTPLFLISLVLYDIDKKNIS